MKVPLGGFDFPYVSKILKIRPFLLPCFGFLWSAYCLLPISIAILLFPLIWFKRGCSCLGSPIWTSWHPLATAGILGMIGTRASHSSWRSYCRTCHIVVHTFSVVKAGRKVPGGVTSYPQVEARMCCIHWDQHCCSFFICWVGFCKSCPILILYRKRPRCATHMSLVKALQFLSVPSPMIVLPFQLVVQSLFVVNFSHCY